MECYVCGHPLPEGANFCPNCGRNRSAGITDPEIITLAPEETAPEETPPGENPPEEILSEPLADELPAEAAPLEPLAESVNDSGAPVPDSAPDFSETVPVSGAVPPARRRSVLIPVLAMAAMLLVGLICFFLLPFDYADSADPTTPVPQDSDSSNKPSLPGHKTQTESSETRRSDEFIPTDEDCFLMTGDGLVFLSYKYDGGPVVVVPNEIGGIPVTRIAAQGFSYCEDVSTIILPDGLESIGDQAFAECPDLRGVYIPGGVTEIGESAFENCIRLESVYINSGVQFIGQDAFDGCASLRYFFYDGRYEDWVALYNEYVTPFTYVTCTDGDYYHGVYIP